MIFKKHEIKAMDSTLVQKCIHCGYLISDYRNAVYPAGSPPPTGFGEGAIYVSEGNPTVLTILISPDDLYTDCVRSNHTS